MKNLYIIILLTFGLGQDYSLQFDGVDDYIDIGNPDILNFTDESNFTISFWFKTDTSKETHSLLEKRNNDGNTNKGIHIFLNYGTMGIQLNDNNNGHDYRGFGNDLANNEWHYLFCTINSETDLLNIYIDSEKVGSNISIINIGNYSNEIPWRLGWHVNSQQTYYNGLFNNFILWTEALTEEEIQDIIYQEPAGNEDGLAAYYKFNAGEGTTLYDHSGNGNHGTIHGGATWVCNDMDACGVCGGDNSSCSGCTDPYADNYDETANADDDSCTYPDNGDYSLSFDGVDDYVDCGNDESLEPVNELSIELFLYLPETQPGYRYQRVLSKSFDIFDFYNSYQIIMGDPNFHGDRAPSFYIYTTDGPAYLTPPTYYSPAEQLSVGWHNIAATYNGEKMELYWDGEKVAEELHTGDILYDDNPLYIGQDLVNNAGYDNYSDYNYSGSISHARIWNYALSDEQIQMHIINSPDYNQEGLVGYWKFNAGEGTTLYDHSGNGNNGTIYGAEWVENIYGCTDSYADNYNSDANWDDGSCTYPDNGDYSLSFDGENDYVDLNQHFLLSNNFSIEIKFNPNSEGFYNYACDSGAQLFMNGGGGGSGIYPDIGIGISDFMSDTPQYNGTCIQLENKVIAVEFGGSSGAYRYYSQEPIILDDMNHIILTFFSGDVKVYLNGEIAIEQSIPISNLNINSASKATLSARNVAPVGYYSHIKGSYSYFSIYDKALTDDDINNILQNNYENLSDNYITLYKFNAGEGTTLYDHSGNGNHGTINGASWAGCTDPLAENYLPGAELDDGSCTGSPVYSSDFTYAGELDGHYYYLSNNTANWENAKIISEDNNGHLVTISNDDENTLVGQHYTGGNYIWIGLFQNTNSPEFSEPDGGWEWVTGEPLDYINWNSGEPNNMGSEQYVFIQENNTWNDANQSVPYRFGLELEKGCTDPTASNYQDYAYADDGSCLYDYCLDLHSGANLISFYALSDDVSITHVMASIEGNATGVIGEGVAANYNGTNWLGSLNTISSLSGYWVIVSEAGSLCIEDGIPTAPAIQYSLNSGANLISFPVEGSVEISSSLPDDIEGFVSGIIGEGVAANNQPPWQGSLSNLSGGNGYWMITTENISFSFDVSTMSRVKFDNEVGLTAPDNKEIHQSTKQAFYFIESIENIEQGDIIHTYSNGINVGSRVWNGSFTDVPAMGDDGSKFTAGYCKDGSIPTFKVEKANGSLITLTGDIPEWSNNQLYMIGYLEESIALPTVYSLSTAYPNPFNPVTTLSFAIPIDSEVSLSIYNLQGREVSTLIDANMDAGYHSIVWDANSYASGVYFVKMMAGEYISTQKLMLIK